MNIDIIFKITAVGIIVSVLSSVLKRADREDIANLVSLAGVVIVLLMVVNLISTLLETMRGILMI